VHYVWRSFAPDWDDSPRTRRRGESLIITCLCGPLAQQRYAPRSHWLAVGWGADFQRASELAEHLVGLQEAGILLERLQRETGDLIDQHWSRIEAVANALIAEKTLDGKRLREVIEATTSVPSPPARCPRRIFRRKFEILPNADFLQEQKAKEAARLAKCRESD
jgi:hypothetical protein